LQETRAGMAPNKGWGLIIDGTTLVNISIDGPASSSNWEGTYTTSPDLDGSNDKASRVKIIRNGDVITAYCTNWMTGVVNFRNAPDYNSASMIQIDLSKTVNNISYYSAGTLSYASKDLSGFKGAKSYGYTTQSQAMSTYLNVVFSGGLRADTLVLLKNKDANLNLWNSSEVWKYTSGNWQMQSGATIQSELGFIRQVTNPDTSITYTIKKLLTDR